MRPGIKKTIGRSLGGLLLFIGVIALGSAACVPGRERREAQSRLDYWDKAIAKVLKTESINVQVGGKKERRVACTVIYPVHDATGPVPPGFEWVVWDAPWSGVVHLSAAPVSEYIRVYYQKNFHGQSIGVSSEDALLEQAAWRASDMSVPGIVASLIPLIAGGFLTFRRYQSRSCPKCGSETRGDFCPRCGGKLASAK